MITLKEARELLVSGKRMQVRVKYNPQDGSTPEYGVITGVGNHFIFVLYDDDLYGKSKSTPPEFLELIE